MVGGWLKITLIIPLSFVSLNFVIVSEYKNVGWRDTILFTSLEQSSGQPSFCVYRTLSGNSVHIYTVQG